MQNMAIICKSCFSSKSRVAQLSTNSGYKNAPQTGAQHFIRLNLLLTVHAIGDIHFPPFRRLKKYLISYDNERSENC